MCFTGICKYEDWLGSCKLTNNYHDDALCVMVEKEINKIEEENNAC